jgi:hypothetical protein
MPVELARFRNSAAAELVQSPALDAVPFQRAEQEHQFGNRLHLPRDGGADLARHPEGILMVTEPFHGSVSQAPHAHSGE